MVLSRTTLLGVHICTHSFIYIHTSWWRNKLHVGHMWRRQWHPTPVLLPRKSHGWRSLVGCGPWGRWELDTTERLHFHFSLSCIEEGNGNPLQCSCLENPRDGGALWAAVYGVSQGQTRLKRLCSSSSRAYVAFYPPCVFLSLSFFFLIYFLLEDNCFTEFCCYYVVFVYNIRSALSLILWKMYITLLATDPQVDHVLSIVL